MDSIDNVKKRTWWRHWRVAFILAILAGIVIWAMLNVGPWLRDWQDKQAADAAKRQLEIAYRDDKYGGTTPEQTVDLFIVALEKDDTDLASKYFVLEKQDAWKRTLDEYKNKALISDFVRELKNTKAELLKSNYNFKKYPSGVWKISTL